MYSYILYIVYLYNQTVNSLATWKQFETRVFFPLQKHEWTEINLLMLISNFKIHMNIQFLKKEKKLPSKGPQ